MKTIALLIFVAVFFIALVFSVLNFHAVQINLGFTSISLPLTIALTIELFAGIVIGLLVALLHIMRLKSEFARVSKQLEQQPKE